MPTYKSGRSNISVDEVSALELSQKDVVLEHILSSVLKVEKEGKEGNAKSKSIMGEINVDTLRKLGLLVS